MGGAGFSAEKYNAREIALSSDLGRGERLLSRELQNILGFGSADGAGAPFSSLLRPLSLTAATGFTMQLADGDAFAYLPTDPTLTADDSPYEVVRWRSVAPLAFATPDGSNPRIDLVVAQPASADADLQSRNILVDPGARTIAAQNVFKTTNPSATISVVTGTPGATPAPPSVPSGKVALLEVLVPAAATDASTFGQAPRLFRRAAFPWSAMSGIISGCFLRWDLSVDASVASSDLTMVGLPSLVVIDGEVIDAGSIGGVSVSQDTAHNPFAVAAGASDKPYYLYLCGGRHCPQRTPVLGGIVPVAVVESTVPPSTAAFGQPSAPITTPTGTTTISGALYIGIGFVVAGTTRRRACVMHETMTEIVGSDIGGTLQLTKAGAGVEALGTPGSRPSNSRRMLGLLTLGAASATAQAHLYQDDGSGTAPSPSAVGVGALGVSPGINTQVAGHQIMASVTFAFGPLSAQIWAGGAGLASGDVITLVPMAYEHRVCRIAGG